MTVNINSQNFLRTFSKCLGFLIIVFVVFDVSAIEQDSYEPIDNRQTGATRLLAGENQQHSIFPKEDIDWYRFTLTESSCVLLTGSYDFGPELTLTDQRGVFLGQSTWWSPTENDMAACDGFQLPDNIGSSSQFLFLESLPAGVYFVQIGFMGTDISQIRFRPSNYTMTLTTAPSSIDQDIYEDNDMRSRATPIPLGVTQEHNFHPRGDVDWLSVVVTQPSTLRVTVDNEFRSERIIVYENDENRRSLAGGGGCLDARLCPGSQSVTNTDVVYPGVYFIEVAQLSAHAAGTAEPYRIKVEAIPIAVADTSDPYEPDNWVTQATVVSNSNLQEHSFGTLYDRDWYVFRLDGCLIIRPEVYTLTQRLGSIRLLDSGLRHIETSSRSTIENGRIEYSFIEKELSRGIYFLSVERDRHNGIQLSGPQPYLFRMLAFDCEPKVKPLNMAPIINLLID